MFKRLFFITSALLLSSQLLAQDIDQTKPYEMMQQVAEQAFSRLKAEQATIQKNPDHLKVVVEEELMPYVNAQYAALKLLGPNLKAAQKENPKGYKKDVGVFIDAFRGYLVTSYAQVLTQYSDQVIEFAPAAKVKPTQRIASVKVDIIDTPRPNIKLEFKLRKNSKTGEWKAFDMIAEGISLLSSKQSEWNGKIRQDGILAVAQELESQASLPIRFESAK